MFIRWRRKKSKKNKLPKQPLWYEVNYYAYLTENARGEDGRIYHKNEIYLGRIKKIGGVFSRPARAVFYLSAEKKLKGNNFTDREIKEVFEMLRKKIRLPEKNYLEEMRIRKELIEKTMKM